MAEPKKIVKKTPDKVAATETKKLGKFERAIFDLTGKELGVVKLPQSIFGVEPNVSLLRQAIRVYIANQHQGTLSTKGRSDVRGGGRKPWRQKGTGRARQGSIRSPQWRGGGVVFGPKPRDLSLDLPTKMKRAALKLALSAKVEDVIVVDQFKLKDAKTKQVATSLKKLNLPGKTLFVLAERQEDIVRAGRNIPGLKIEIAKDLNALEVVSAHKLVFAKDTLAQFEGKDAT